VADPAPNPTEERPMKPAILIPALLLATMAVAGDEAPSPAEQMAGLATMCENTAQARADRHAAKPLYERLGGYDRIHALTEEIVRLHSQNEDFRLMMTYVDKERLVKNVADFVAAGTGGDVQYAGRDIKTAHAHLRMTTSDFLSAGGDVAQAMHNLGYGEDETNEIVCILVSMKDLVVYD
jgi:hemoglobin